MSAPKCPHCARELHSSRQRQCQGCGKPVDAKALEAIQDALAPKPGVHRVLGVDFGSEESSTFAAWGGISITHHYNDEAPATGRLPPREVECEIVERKMLPAANEKAHVPQD